VNPFRKLRLFVSMVRYANAHNRDFAREHAEFYGKMCEELRPWVGDLRGLRVLDVGCGKAMWLTLLLHSAGARVTGIDTEFLDPSRSPRKYWAIAQSNGWERAVRTLVWDLAYAGPYYRALAVAVGRPLVHAGLDARRTTVEALEEDEGVFDLVVSHEVFEHIADVDAVLARLARLLKPSGLTYIYIHNVASLSGGHHIAWKYPDTEPSTVVPPWDHLRERRFPDIPSWINGWRMERYREAFERHFEILSWRPGAVEGESLLTPALEAELSSYPREELLTKGYVIIARPKPEKTA
jgi:SAM-dependent methyltransferase